MVNLNSIISVKFSKIRAQVYIFCVQAATAADDSDRMRKVFESRAVQVNTELRLVNTDHVT